MRFLAVFQESPQEGQRLKTLTDDIIVAYNNLAIAYTHKENKKAAANVYYNLGMIFSEIGVTKLAIAEFEKGLGIDPNPSFDTYSLLGKLYHRTKSLKKSAELLEKALEIDPNSASAHNNLGMVYAELASQEDTKKVELAHIKQTLLENAKKEFEKAIEISPKFSEAHDNLAVYYYGKEDYRNALKEWEIIYEINPEYPNLKKNLESVRKKLQIIK